MIDFTQVENSVRALKKQLVKREIDEKTFEDRLLEMIDVAEDGYYWMFGHESERWFRHDGRQWVPDNPARLIASRNATEMPASSHPRPIADHTDNSEQPALSWRWILASLGLLAMMGSIVYTSSMG